jgi:hypothetical protein
MTCVRHLAADEGRADPLLEVGLLIVVIAHADQSDGVIVNFPLN